MGTNLPSGTGTAGQHQKSGWTVSGAFRAVKAPIEHTLQQSPDRADAEENVINWNEDKPWSEMDVFDLQNNVARGDLVEETAEFLMRREDEVRQKIMS